MYKYACFRCPGEMPLRPVSLYKIYFMTIIDTQIILCQNSLPGSMPISC